MNIRYATMADLDDIASVESECFPVLEAATKGGDNNWLNGHKQIFKSYFAAQAGNNRN